MLAFTLALVVTGARCTPAAPLAAPSPLQATEPEELGSDIAAAVERGALSEAQALLSSLLATLPPDADAPFDEPTVALLRELAPLALASKGVLQIVQVFERLHAHYALTASDFDPNLLWAREELARAFGLAGDAPRSVELFELLLDVRETQLEPDDPELSRLRGELASSLFVLGEHRRAADVIRREIVHLRELWDEDDDRLIEREINLATTRAAVGDLATAAHMFDDLVARLQETRPADSRVRLTAEFNFANVLRMQGHLNRALPLFRNVVAVRKRVLPVGNPDRVQAEIGFAALTAQLGDVDVAREMFESMLKEAKEHLLPGNRLIPIIQTNLAIALRGSRRPEEALPLLEETCSTMAQTYAPDHPELLGAMQEWAAALKDCDRLDEAAELHTLVLERRLDSLPKDHADVQQSHARLAETLLAMGETADARAHFEEARASARSTLPEGHDWRRALERHLAFIGLSEDDQERAAQHASALAGETRAAIRTVTSATGGRDLEQRLIELEHDVAALVTLASELGRETAHTATEALAFELVESMRGAFSFAGLVARRSADHPQVLAARTRLANASREVTRVMQAGGRRDLLRTAVFERDDARRAVLAAILEQAPLRELLHSPSPDRLAATLADDEVMCTIRRLDLPVAHERGAKRDVFVAWTLRSDGTLTRHELAAAERIEEAVGDWRASLGRPVQSRGVALGAAPEQASVEDAADQLYGLIFKPLEARLAQAQRLTLALDDVLLLVPITALPSGAGLFGERWRIELRASLWERIFDTAPSGAPDVTLAVGGVDFANAADGAELRWQEAFGPLPGSADEARAVVELRRSDDDHEAFLMEGSAATKDEFVRRLPHARFVHVATHGFFAPELEAPKRGEEQASLAPMSLCGLAFAGVGRSTVAGGWGAILTAEELASLNLSGCELAVLSACDTSVGVRRASRGIASLRSAMHAAGARSVVTSLWKVPDETTRRLMVDFYRRMWTLGESKADALFGAQMKLRAEGLPLADWAGWVLTGQP